MLKGQRPEDKARPESDSSVFEPRGKIGAKNENNPHVYNEIFQVARAGGDKKKTKL